MLTYAVLPQNWHGRKTRKLVWDDPTTCINSQSFLLLRIRVLPVPGPRGDRAHCHMTQESDCQKSQTIRALPLWHSRVCFWLNILFVVFGA